MSSLRKNFEQRHVLLLSQGVPPHVSGSSTTIANLALAFSPAEMTVAGEKSLGHAGWPSDRPSLKYLIDEWFPRMRGRGRLMPVALPARTSLITARAYSLAKKVNATEIVAAFPDEAFLFAGYAAARLLGIRFFPYFHNTYVENRLGVQRVFAEHLQKRVFQHAAHVFVMSEGMVDFYREKYPALKNCSALVHSLAHPIPAFSPSPNPGDVVNLGMLGSINESCLDAAKRLKRAFEGIPGLRINIMSPIPKWALSKMGMLGEMVTTSSPPAGELSECLRRNDVLLLPHGLSGPLSAVEYRTIFPTRTIDYLISGRPILAHVPKETFLWRFLTAHKCALIVDQPNEGDLRSALARLRNDADMRNELVKNALHAAKQFSSTEVRQHLLATIDASRAT